MTTNQVFYVGKPVTTSPSFPLKAISAQLFTKIYYSTERFRPGVREEGKGAEQLEYQENLGSSTMCPTKDIS